MKLFMSSSLAALTVGLMLQTTIAKADPASDALACDLVGASPFDVNRPKNVAGVAPDKIDANLAIPACETALKSNPKDARMKFALARALTAGSKDPARSFQLYKEAADAGNIPATLNLGNAYYTGIGVAVDKVKARSLQCQAVERMVR